MTPSFKWLALSAWIVGIAGMKIATGTWSARAVMNTSAATFMAQKIWINTGSGWTIRAMARFGRPRWLPDGRRIAMAAGFGKTFMAGPGSATILGAGRRITTAAGSMADADGAGIPARFTAVI